MSEIPEWAVDVVIALQKHRDEHPIYHAEYYPDYKMRRAATCGCEPLAFVPREVKLAAELVAADRNRREQDVPHDGRPDQSEVEA